MSFVCSKRNVGVIIFLLNSIFVPAAGNCFNGSVNNVGSSGGLWSSSLIESVSRNAWNLSFDSDGVYVSGGNRCNGFSVRAVL